ncbi:MAG: trimeric intracellular cation channel family protein [Mycobacteriaceae bacterium]
MLLAVLNLVGVAAFAASGALAAVRARLDLFGVCVLGATTALGGGVLRDLLLGISPPTSLVDYQFLLVALAVSLVVFRFNATRAWMRRGVLVLDAVGMGLFATGGAATALDQRGSVLAACIIGMTTAIGGGVLRDLLLREIPLVLRREVYALAALAGSVVVVGGTAAGVGPGLAVLIGTVVATGLRGVTLWRGWNVPQPRST